MRANLVPGLILQAFALAVVLAYYLHPDTRQTLDRLAAFKSHWGWRYSLIATAIFGGLIPFLYMRWNLATRAHTPPSHWLFYLPFWAYKGVEVDLFYRLQGWMFGNGIDARTIFLKVLMDQFIYSVVWSLPISLAGFYWKDAGFRFASLRRLDWPAYLKESMPRSLLGVWGVWIPAVTIIYSLPPALQIPLFNIVLCFYALLLAALTRKGGDAAEEAGTGPAAAASPSARR